MFSQYSACRGFGYLEKFCYVSYRDKRLFLNHSIKLCKVFPFTADFSAVFYKGGSNVVAS